MTFSLVSVCRGATYYDSLDANPVRAGLSSSVGSAKYAIWADIDGNGIVNSLDATAIRANLSKSLPAGEPTIPAAASVAGFIQMTPQ